MLGGQGNNSFGSMMGGMGGYGNTGVQMLQNRLPFMNKNPNQQTSGGMANFGGQVNSMPGQVQRFAPQGNPVLGSMLPSSQQMIQQGSALARMPRARENGVNTGPMDSMPMGNGFGVNSMVNKLQDLMPQNFNANPQMGGLLQNPQLLMQLLNQRGLLGNQNQSQLNRVR